MKIESLSFSYPASGWKVTDVQLEDLTLLVGASGVGKTKILECVETLKDIATNLSYGRDKKESIIWNIKFTLLNQNKYEWKGERKLEFGFVKEEIYLNRKSIIKREGGKVFLAEGTTLKLNSESSLLYLMGEDERLKPIVDGFRFISYDQWSTTEVAKGNNYFDEEGIEKEEYTLEELQQIKQSALVKFYLAHKANLPVVQQIENQYIDIFPFVECFLVEKNVLGINGQTFNSIDFYIKERGVEHYIHELELSSGMYRTFLQLCELYLSPEGTVFLIDEFENSLGINCIDELTSAIKGSSHRKLQFIITSHHPYIINQIHYKNWKLVTRHAGQVKVQNATDLIDFEKSRQQAFMQLTQLEEFTTGISE